MSTQSNPPPAGQSIDEPVDESNLGWIAYGVRYDSIPLAVYREIAAHLRCIAGTEVELEWNTTTTFRYDDSQISALLIRQAPDANALQIKQVLNHYGLWQKSQEQILTRSDTQLS